MPTTKGSLLVFVASLTPGFVGLRTENGFLVSVSLRCASSIDRIGESGRVQSRASSLRSPHALHCAILVSIPINGIATVVPATIAATRRIAAGVPDLVGRAAARR